MPPLKKTVRRKNKRQHQLKTRKGGAVIGKGAYGCVYRPALRCPANATVNRSQQISKLVKRENIPGELHGVDILRAIDPAQNVFLYPLDESCAFNINAQPDKGNVLRSFQRTCPIAGIDKSSYILFNKDGGSSPNRAVYNADTYYPFFEGLVNIFRGINHLHLNGAVHHDIKPDNMVLNVNPAGNGLNFRLIDFGLLQKINDANGIKIKFATEQVVNTRYDSRYIIWPFYSFLYAYNKSSIMANMYSTNPDIRTKFVNEFLFSRFQEWENTIHKYVGVVPEKAYYMNYTHNKSTLGSPEDMKNTIRKILENENTYANFAKNIDIYSLGVTLSMLFTRMFGTTIHINALGNEVVHFYIPRHGKYEPYNVHDWKNPELDAWVRNFVETVATPFYALINELCRQDIYETERSLDVLQKIYSNNFLKALYNAIYQPGTYTEQKGFIKFLHYIKPNGFDFATAPAYPYTPIPRTPIAPPLVAPIVQALAPPMLRTPTPKRKVQVTGRGVTAPSQGIKRQLTPTPSTNSNVNSTGAVVGHAAKRTTVAAAAAATNFNDLSPIVSAPKTARNNEEFFQMNQIL